MHALALSLAGFAAALGVTDRALGTWRLNAAKSTLVGDAPQSETWQHEANSGWLQTTVTRVPAAGRPQVMTFRVKLDGQEYPVRGDSSIKTVAAFQLDAVTMELLFRAGTSEVMRIRNEFSIDGKTCLSTSTSRGADGNKITQTAIYEKVDAKRAARKIVAGVGPFSRLGKM